MSILYNVLLFPIKKLFKKAIKPLAWLLIFLKLGVILYVDIISKMDKIFSIFTYNGLGNYEPFKRLDRLRGEKKKMKEWLFDQVYHFNVIIFISIMIFNVALSKNNTQKLIQNQSKELYLEIEEVKDELRELKK
jgi:hypothetical protein